MYRNKFTNRVRFTLWTCLIALNIILRIPTTPHEIGWDTFAIHILTNSISEFGWAMWWVNPLSIGGFYPYSYASVVPFLVSGISQCTGIGMERTVWLFCAFIGVSSAFFAYIMAGAIKNNDIFKFLVAFGYSVAPGILNFSTWQLSARGCFMVLLPLFVYLLLKTRTSIIRWSSLSFILLVVLTLTHHLFYFAAAVAFSYVAAIAFYKLKTHIKVSENFVNLAFIIFFIAVLLLPFFTRNFIQGGRYNWLFDLVPIYMRYTGVLLVFVIGGFAYLLLKYDKGVTEWFLLFAMLCLAPFLYIQTYAVWFFILFAFILAGIGLTNITKVYRQKGRVVFSIIIICLLLSVSFSGFYQYSRTNMEGIHYYNEWYMEDGTYVAGLWIKNNIDKALVCNDGLISMRTFAISGIPTLTGFGTSDLAYGFTNMSELNISKVSPLSTVFYLEGPYIRTPHTAYTGYYVSMLNENDFDGYYGTPIISKFNLSYVIENEDIGDNPFIRSVHREKNNIYDNRKIQIWALD
ncbi:MAG: hypothetical protein EMLJLAPB_00237 [Candidatus Argoarchaeum ethanivorans]|uniref:Membrane protein 6-pyruvoyl-tetrahydropterin synthase-related domain-containing protein n=1 Tax=Candidatus Argoarchaeum ethanivorans TaxID=2608793 RepID=A0A811T918_9EURY|nr:MAG: hypothetical protein EMLJLAPB_00237 [Candidatus Argoarchaeum ethanivorans]